MGNHLPCRVAVGRGDLDKALGQRRSRAPAGPRGQGYSLYNPFPWLSPSGDLCNSLPESILPSLTPQQDPCQPPSLSRPSFPPRQTKATQSTPAGSGLRSCSSRFCWGGGASWGRDTALLQFQGYGAGRDLPPRSLLVSSWSHRGAIQLCLPVPPRPMAWVSLGGAEVVSTPGSPFQHCRPKRTLSSAVSLSLLCLPRSSPLSPDF